MRSDAHEGLRYGRPLADQRSRMLSMSAASRVCDWLVGIWTFCKPAMCGILQHALRTGCKHFNFHIAYCIWNTPT